MARSKKQRTLMRWHKNILSRNEKSGYNKRMRAKGVEPIGKGSPLRPALDSMLGKKKRAKATAEKRRASRRKNKRRK